MVRTKAPSSERERDRERDRERGGEREGGGERDREKELAAILLPSYWMFIQ